MKRTWRVVLAWTGVSVGGLVRVEGSERGAELGAVGAGVTVAESGAGGIRGVERAQPAMEERPAIFAARVEEAVSKDDGTARRRPLLSAVAKRRIAEQVLSDLEEEPKADARGAAGRSAEALGADSDVVVLERYVVRGLATPEISAPKNRWLETIRTGRLYQNRGPRTTKTVDLLGSSVWNSSVGDTGDAKMTLKFTIWW